MTFQMRYFLQNKQNKMIFANVAAKEEKMYSLIVNQTQVSCLAVSPIKM
jgi:hypothetical protein